MTSRRDSRVPVRVLEVGSMKAEVFETKGEGRRYEFSIGLGGKIVLYRHELARLVVLAELLHREADADYVAELEAEIQRKAAGA